MITYEGITEVNKGLPKVDIKGKKYSIVAARIQGFRKLIPDGMIKTEIVSIDDSRVVMTATIADGDGKVLATGTAFEEKGSSYINKTSYVENCETSAVGRALAMLGIGSEENMCSADELVNAINGQNSGREKKEKPQDNGYPPVADMVKACEAYYKGENLKRLCDYYSVKAVSELNYGQLCVAWAQSMKGRQK